MNPNTGEIKSSFELDKLSDFISDKFTVPVNLDDMTDEQRARYESGEQPVVKIKDTRSFLAHKRLQEVKTIKARRAKNKKAKKARKNNRK